jgi:hypothetical protein
MALPKCNQAGTARGQKFSRKLTGNPRGSISGFGKLTAKGTGLLYGTPPNPVSGESAIVARA